MSDRTVARSLGNLVLALLNATLILSALCLWLTLSAFSAAGRVSADLRAAVEVVLPLQEEAQALTAEIAAARRDIAALQEAGVAAPANLAALQDGIDRMEAQLARLTVAISSLENSSTKLIDRAIEIAFREAGTVVLRAADHLGGEASVPHGRE
jgi:septal ring factor EnvC (AmiA/AmiB activator)